MSSQNEIAKKQMNTTNLHFNFQNPLELETFEKKSLAKHLLTTFIHFVLVSVVVQKKN